ncbi:uncharacterized protein V1513DRAFT_53636 [Lipomyces chichibuensis]|uniref:uncharacterized protein n=1 Tax=Lipomyces chichibuensis TaxID=1546026 RepID=UPI003343CD3C
MYDWEMGSYYTQQLHDIIMPCLIDSLFFLVLHRMEKYALLWTLQVSSQVSKIKVSTFCMPIGFGLSLIVGTNLWMQWMHNGHITAQHLYNKQTSASHGRS